MCATLRRPVLAATRVQRRYVAFSKSGGYSRASSPRTRRSCGSASGMPVLKPFLGPGSLLVLEGERHLRERRLVMPAFHNKAIAGYGEIIRDACSPRRVCGERGTSSSREVVCSASRWTSSCERCSAFEGPRTAPTSNASSSRSSTTVGSTSGSCAARRIEASRGPRDIPPAVRANGRPRRPSSRGGGATPWRPRVTCSRCCSSEGRGRPRKDRRRAARRATDARGDGVRNDRDRASWGVYWIAERTPVRERFGGGDARPRPCPDTQVRPARVSGRDMQGDPPHLPDCPAVFREVVQPFRVGDYVFEPGTILSPSVYLTHRRDDLYEEPDTFEPERFLEGSIRPTSTCRSAAGRGDASESPSLSTR